MKETDYFEMLFMDRICEMVTHHVMLVDENMKQAEAVGQTRTTRSETTVEACPAAKSQALPLPLGPAFVNGRHANFYLETSTSVGVIFPHPCLSGTLGIAQ